MLLRACCLLVLTVVLAPHAPAGAALERAKPDFDALAGLYQFEDGRLRVVFDLVDQMRTHQLVVLDPESGRVWTLHARPVADGDVSFDSRAGWFAGGPAGGQVRFTSAAGAITGIVVEQDGRTAAGTRVRFREREVAFRNGDIRLSGTLILPEGGGPHPGLVLVHGSGPLTRRVPAYMGRLFAHRGIAALVYDKRGTGASTGRWQTASYEDLAGDATAAFARLAGEPDIDGARAGIFGSSEAGYIVPAVAARDPRVSFLVCRVCPALPQRVVSPGDRRSELVRQGLQRNEIEDAVSFHRLLIAYAVEKTGRAALEEAFERHRARPWMARYGFTRVPPPDAPYWPRFAARLTVDPRESYARLEIPVLVVLGELDDRIRVEEHRTAFLEAARRSGRRDFSLEVMPGATHGLLQRRLDPDGQELPPERFAPAFHELVLDWVSKHTAQPLRRGERPGAS